MCVRAAKYAIYKDNEYSFPANAQSVIAMPQSWLTVARQVSCTLTRPQLQ